MSEFTIKPLDTFFFRDGKPFDMGENTFASTLVSLIPSNFYGAIASAYIAQNGGTDILNDRKTFEVIKDVKTGRYGSFVIKGVFFKKGDKLLFPTPLDIYKKDEELAYAKIMNTENGKFITSLKMGMKVLLLRGKSKFDINPFIDQQDFKNYLLGDLPGDSESLISYRNIFEIEPKIGIKKDRNSFAAEEGMLYRVNYLRAQKDVSISVFSTGIKLYNEGFLKIGGKDKTAYYSYKNDNLCIKDVSLDKSMFVNGIGKENYFKLYLATPAIFDNGWLIDGFEEKSGKFVYEKDSFSISIIAAAIDKSKVIGGWDMVKKAPKAGFKIVPEGSVYFLKLEKGSPQSVFDEFNCKNIGRLKEEGFGLSLLGIYKEGE